MTLNRAYFHDLKAPGTRVVYLAAEGTPGCSEITSPRRDCYSQIRAERL